MRLSIAAMALSVTLLSACGGGGDASVAVDFKDQTLVQFRPYPQGEYVIRSRDQLQADWAAVPFQRFPIGIVLSEPAFPEYDYQASMLVGVSLGIGKWCFAPQITSVTISGNDMEVDYRVPTSSTLACLADAPLISFALVPRVTGSVTFRNTGA